MPYGVSGYAIWGLWVWCMGFMDMAYGVYGYGVWGLWVCHMGFMDMAYKVSATAQS